ncbi:MAG: FAD-binding and (Fe-S)-binding domain-containing protein, partial [Anaerolineae bacterium]
MEALAGSGEMFDFANELQKRISGELHTDEISRILYSTDASIYQVMPHGVLIPKTMDDVQAAVELAAQYRVPLLARTAGSSLAGQAVNAALVVDFTRHLDQILELNVAERWVRVQPGVVLDRMNAYLRPHSLQFGPDPASGNRAAMGGIVSNNSTGSHSIRYGMTADHVAEANVILNDGSVAGLAPFTPNELQTTLKQNGRFPHILRQLTHLTQNPTNQDIIRTHTPRHWRRCGGYNLDRLIPGNGRISTHHTPDPRFNVAKLFCGAEGTLGILTDITLNLVPVPTMTGLAILQFDDLHAALTAVPTILETDPSAVELLDNRQLTLCRSVPKYARLLPTFIDGHPFCLLITEFYGESEAELRYKIDRLQQHIKQQGVNITGIVPLLDPKRQKNVWAVRKGGLGLLMSMKGDYKPLPFIEDSAVPVAHLDEYVTRLEQFCADLGTEMAYYAHASAGCLHIRPIINTKKAAEIAKLPQIAEFAVDLLRGYGGAWSSEHGDGRSRSWLNKQFFGPQLYDLYRQVKHIFDPDNLFNPGNIVDAGPMTKNLRYGDGYEVIPLTTKLSFHTDQGFDRAIEMCNGAGVCRKLAGGAMCPSFMATREEAHSTRGRANALRAVLDGRLPATDLTGPRLYEIMELCVSCKACKSEC